MEIYCLSRKTLNLTYSLSSLLFSLSSKTLLLPNKHSPISPQFHTISSTDSSTYSSSFPSTPCPPSFQFLNAYNFRWFRSFSAASSSGLDASAKQISEIINFIRSGENNLESKLDGMNVSLSEASLNSIFRVLNCQKISALRLFNWIRKSHPEFYHNSDICSLVIDNCGRLDDFDSMFNLLNDFRLHGICLNQKAFGYLPAIVSSKASTEKSICKVVEVLNEIGGSCGVSGIHALIEMFCVLGSFQMAKYVIANTGKRLSNYNILIRGMCRVGDFQEAREILDGMIKVGCNPNSQPFNYVLSCLCKNDKTAEAGQLLEQMLRSSCPPDALTFEVYICYLCKLGKLDMAFEWFDGMVSRGIEPRASTHAAFIKGYFKLKQYHKAYKYVVVCSEN
ncbi:hypothetical protein REPUB_Repub16aG0034700 [Reevesia pubescens]